MEREHWGAGAWPVDCRRPGDFLMGVLWWLRGFCDWWFGVV